METKEFMEKKISSFNWQLSLKVITIGLIGLVLMVPKMMILGLIHEREQTAESARHEVMQKWSLEQTVRGPVLTIPYLEKVPGPDGKEIREEIHQCHFLPDSLYIEGTLNPQELHRGIYQSVVYQSNITIRGRFARPDFSGIKVNPANVLWDKAQLSLAISDLRGIDARTDLNWNSQSIPFSPGMDNKLLGDNGISLTLPGQAVKNFPANFQLSLKLKGSDALQFAPLGETTEVKLQSIWNAPGFTGNFLPANRTISQKGFNAYWKILNYNRNFPQAWKDNEFKVTDADFGVQLVTLADHYQKSYRSAKYGILVILFLFLSFFLNETITKRRIHPFQYILVGFAILIFYLLLLSISEQLGFDTAYLIAAVSVLALVFAYSLTFLKTWLNAALLTAILAFSFGFIFILMQLESYALLVGSVGLFCVLALTMFFTRKINWYGE